MAVAVCHDAWKQVACMYCTTSDHAFGPIFTGPSAGDDARDFIQWVADNGPFEGCQRARFLAHTPHGKDPRDYTDKGLERLVRAWRDMYGVEDEGDGREPDGQRLEGHRVVPTDR